MSATVFIDLGEDWSVAEERQDRPRWRAVPRVPAAALILVGVLLLAGGSAVVVSPFTRLGSMAIQGVSATQIGGGGVFVAGGSGTALVVARYAADSGAKTWEVAVPNRPDALDYLPGAGVLTVWHNNGQDGSTQVTVLDAGSGALLWQLSGRLYLPSELNATQALMVADDADAPARYTDLRTGRAIWTRPVPPGAQIVATDGQVPPDAVGFVVAAPDGTITLLARDTGEVRGSLKVDRLVPDNAEVFNSALVGLVNVIGGRLFVSRRIGTPAGEIASYDLPGLTLQWTRSGQLPGYPWPCGRDLCLSGLSGELATLDPATGASRWTVQGWQFPDDLGGGRLLAFRDDSLERAGILESTTGRLLGDLGNWTLLPGPDVRLASQPVQGDYRSTWIGLVDPDRAVVRPLGKLEGLNTARCMSRGDLLVCRTLDANVRVWRYRSGA